MRRETRQFSSSSSKVLVVHDHDSNQPLVRPESTIAAERPVVEDEDDDDDEYEDD